ncbi:MAG: glycosyltransferase, partial [Solirubrobacteraceae bacterium]
LFIPARGGAGHGSRRATAGIGLTLAAAAALIAVSDGILAAIGATESHLIAAAVGLGIASVAWLPATGRWGTRARLCWAATTYLFVVYLAFMVWWTFDSGLGVVGTIGGMLLWLLEVVAAFLGCAYLWELCDTLGRASWERRVGERELERLPDGPYPSVCLQVPCYNEPPDMVIATLESLLALDYPSFEIQVLDDNTDDESLWRPVQAWCREHDVSFVHLSDWPGYKSGALNYALERMMPDACELIGVVDSDYQIEPDFLRRCAPLFADERVGFIQAPQDYRGWESAPFYRRLYYSYKYFFAVSQPSRNERDGAIFAGTMGLIRRRALDAVGGWDEWCITEDAELSLRLLRAGWSGLHVDRSFGRGIMPLTFEALKGQRFRWCFGGIQILRRHWRSMLPGSETEENHLSLGQRWAYLCGAIQWYGDLLALLFYVCLIVGAANIAFSGGLVFRKLTGFLLAAIPLLVALGLLRAVALLRRGTRASWRDAFGAFLIWQSTTLTVASASLQGLFAKQAAFLRTPKTHGDPKWSDALRANWAECLLGLLGLIAIGGALARTSSYGGVLLAVLLIWPTTAFLAAPYNSLSAQSAALPPDLRERRRTEQLRYGTRRLTYAAGGLGLAGGTAALALGLFVPGTANVVAPQLVGPARGHPPHYGSTAPPGRPARGGTPGHNGHRAPEGSAHARTRRTSSTSTSTTSSATTSASSSSTSSTSTTTSFSSTTTSGAVTSTSSGGTSTTTTPSSSTTTTSSTSSTTTSTATP